MCPRRSASEAERPPPGPWSSAPSVSPGLERRADLQDPAVLDVQRPAPRPRRVRRGARDRRRRVASPGRHAAGVGDVDGPPVHGRDRGRRRRRSVPASRTTGSTRRARPRGTSTAIARRRGRGRSSVPAPAASTPATTSSSDTSRPRSVSASATDLRGLAVHHGVHAALPVGHDVAADRLHEGADPHVGLDGARPSWMVLPTAYARSSATPRAVERRRRGRRRTAGPRSGDAGRDSRARLREAGEADDAAPAAPGGRRRATMAATSRSGASRVSARSCMTSVRSPVIGSPPIRSRGSSSRCSPPWASSGLAERSAQAAAVHLALHGADGAAAVAAAVWASVRSS